MTYRILLPALVASGLSGLLPASASGQSAVSGRPEPRLPGAVEKAPAWLKDAPFDVAKFFEMPPAAQNGAPLYLDAFFEFGTELEPIFPPAVRKRSATIMQRAKQAGVVFETWVKDPEKADRASVDAILAEFRDGFRKLDLAQRRPRCVFAIGLTIDAPVTHAQVSRAAARILIMRASRALDRDEFNSAIGDLGKIFRMSRDLRPRGVLICQLVSVALDSFACHNGITPFLAHRKLKVNHCDGLLKLLADHESQAIDPFAEGTKADYVMNRSVLRMFAEGIKTTLDADGRPVETRLNRPAGVEEVVELLRMIGTEADPAKAAAMNLTDPKALARDRQSFDDCARSMLATPPSYADRVRKVKELEKAHLEGRPDSFFKLLRPDYSTLSQTCARGLVYLRATQCLVALRRWQLTSKTAPTDLAEVCRAAKMPGVPVDAFSGSSLKMAVIDGEPLVYSVGPDGVDDRGLKDAELGKKPEGDYLFRLPKPK